jgi:hypothetical protein
VKKSENKTCVSLGVWYTTGMKDKITHWIATLATLFTVGFCVLMLAAVAVDFITAYFLP